MPHISLVVANGRRGQGCGVNHVTSRDITRLPKSPGPFVALHLFIALSSCRLLTSILAIICFTIYHTLFI